MRNNERKRLTMETMRAEQDGSFSCDLLNRKIIFIILEKQNPSSNCAFDCIIKKENLIK